MTDHSRILDLPREALASGMDMIDLLITTGLAATSSDARHLIRSAQARLNGRVIPHEGVSATLTDLDAQGFLRLSAGSAPACMIRAG